MSKSYWMKEQKGNFSNDGKDTFDPKKKYVGARLQQGVPLLDRDWNELEDIRRYEEVMLRKWYIGNGSPDDGFKICALDPPASDFKIVAGRCLVDGFEAVNEPYFSIDAKFEDDLNNETISEELKGIFETEGYTLSGDVKVTKDEEKENEWVINDGEQFIVRKEDGKLNIYADHIRYLQQEGISDLSAPSTNRIYTVYLDVWIEEVTSDDDDALKNPDIGLPTCFRHKLEWRVRVAEDSESSLDAEAYHHYYDIARVTRTAGEDTIPNASIQDIRTTGLAVHLLKEATTGLTRLTNNSVVDGLHRHSKLVASDGSPDPALSVDKDGNVGIGTDDPKEKLHVDGSIRGNQNGALRLNTGNGYVDIGPKNQHWSHFLTDRPGYYFDKEIRVVSGKIGSYVENLSLCTGGTARITILNSNGNVGNVGIGTDDPKEKLHVDGSIRGNQNGALRLNTGNGYVDIGPKDQHWSHFLTDRPGYYFDKEIRVVSGKFGSLDENLSLCTGGTARITILNSNGNVGIGTASPKLKLDVNGSTRSLCISVNNAANTGVGRGLWLWRPSDSKHVIYRASPTGTSPANKTAVEGHFNNGYRLRLRTASSQGFLFENDKETALVDIDSEEGKVWTKGAIHSGKQDLAENYLSDKVLEPGDVVCLDKDKDRIVLTDKPNNILVLGVISTEPGFLLDVEHDIEKEKAFPVALCGRVPCKVADENGPIKRGDLLTSSSTLGHAMKARPLKMDEQEFFSPGTIIGKALGSLESGKGVIDIFVFLM